MKLYPALKERAVDAVSVVMEFIIRERQYDVQDWNNLPQRFMLGRKVGKVPSSSADVAATDKIGDFNYDASYFYILVDNSGAAWRRATLGSW